MPLSHCFRTPTWVPLDSLQNPVLLCVARTHLYFCPPWEALLAQTPLPGLAPEGQGLFCAPFHQLCCYLTHLTAIPCRICLGAGSGLSELPAVSHQGDEEASMLFPVGAGRAWAEGGTVPAVRQLGLNPGLRLRPHGLGGDLRLWTQNPRG